MRGRTTQFLLALAGATALSSPVWAQSAAPTATEQASAADQSTGLEEVVVTATKVETVAQKTAISMTVYTPDQIQEQGIHDIASLAGVDPSVKLTTSNGAAYVAIRGVASTDTTEIGDPAVSVARDGFFSNRSFGLFASLYDVQRIEVLKGPQGTLFGRNSTGGLINIISARPGKDFSGYASAEFGSYEAHNFEGAINVPLADWAQLRASGVSRTHEGYRDNSPATVRGDDENVHSFRLQLAVQPIEGLNGLITYQHDEQGGVGDVSANTPLGVTTDFDTFDADAFPLYTDTSVNMSDNRVRWELTYDNLPYGLSFYYSGGWDETKFDHALDATVFPGAINPQEQFVQQENPRTINHEVRLASNSDARLAWQVGYFYFNEKNTLASGLQNQSGPFAGRYLIHFDYDVDTTSNAVFGQASYRFTDQLKLTGGARWTHDEKVRIGTAQLDCEVAGIPPFVWPFIGCNGTPPLLITQGNGEISESKPTYHVGLDYQATDRNLLYAKFDTGYKSGGFNSNGSSPSVNYGPETLWAIEVGSKNRFMDNRVQANLAVFYQDYSGYQASQFTPALGGGPGIQNAGSARIWGAEGELTALVDPIGKIFVNATLLNARFTEFLAVDPSGTTTVDLAGNDLPNAPDFTITAGVEHVFDFDGWNMTAHLDGKYQSDSFSGFFNLEDTKLPAYFAGNAWLTFEPADGHWQLQAYVRNFTNETIVLLARENTLSNSNNYQFAPPRTYGAKLSFKW